MWQRLILGQLTVIAGLLLLLASVPWLPLRYGLPPTRGLEMLPIWLGLVGMTAGFRMTRVTWDHAGGIASASAGTRQGFFLASLGILVANAVCVFALANLTYTTLWGARLLRLGNWMRLYPQEVGYLLAIPLLAALLAQVSCLLSNPHPSPFAVHRSFSLGRVLLQSLCGLLGLLFLCLLLASALSRWPSVPAVALTWVASFVFLLLSLGDLLWAAGPVAVQPNGIPSSPERA